MPFELSASAKRGLPVFFGLLLVATISAAAEPVDFVRDIQPILLSRCSECHGEKVAKSGLRLDVKAPALAGSESGKVIVPGQSSQSPLIERMASHDDDKMPPSGDPITPEQLDLFKRWIDQGATWPEGVDKSKVIDKYDWWSLKPLTRPPVPASRISGDENQNPIDAFIREKLHEKGLKPSPAADRQTLIRRLYFDLIGLPPTPEEVQAFTSDTDAKAYDKLVDRLLESPHYGERWARHWLDVVHYGDTHGYDKDKPRPNAWPYRDYVIRSFNSDKPYSRFIEEQIAGDILYPGTEDGFTATGFIAAGPWDFIGHAEVPESKTDGMIARMLDRDDMVSNTCNSFLSLTVQCARCHNHKFDPVVQEDYYRLQAVFAALDRADRSYDADSMIAAKRAELIARLNDYKEKQNAFDAKITELGGEKLKELDAQIAAARKPDVHPLAAQFGYHSQIESEQTTPKWVQVDLGDSTALSAVEIVGCHDDFNGIGAGFGFPVRFKIDLCDEANFSAGVTTVVDQTTQDFSNPGVTPVRFNAAGKSGRYVRVTATKLAPRQNDFIFALAELKAINLSGKNIASGTSVRSLDSIEAAPRWRTANLVDGYYFGIGGSSGRSLAELQQDRESFVASILDDTSQAALAQNAKNTTDATEALKALPPSQKVYSGMVYSGSGAFTGTGGKPRVIQVLARGDVRKPMKVVNPGTVPLRADEPGEFVLPEGATEGERRVALAKWISGRDNPLTWRSIVNRVWLYHFGRGIVDSPSDFGRMGQLPTHPELLDWLAVEFRDNDQSFKQLHRLIVSSETYRQTSNPIAIEDMDEAHSPLTIDSGNVYLWRMNRRRLEAEAVRDSVLAISGKLKPELGGPAFQDFVVEKPEHSPHYEYQLHDPEDERIHRRSIYRFLVRSQPQPFMTTLDCADPSMAVDKRSETVTALQALTMLNNRLMLTMEKYMAQRVARQESDPGKQVDLAFRLALSRTPSEAERQELTHYATEFGLPSLCRVLMNLNEFVFVD